MHNFKIYICSILLTLAIADHGDNSGDYAIIGGGLAGLEAYLGIKSAHPHAKVFLLEAQDRLGGRVKCENLEVAPGETYPVAIGAQFAHGNVDNPLYDIAE